MKTVTTTKLDYQGLAAPMVKAIQELNLKLDDLASTSSAETQNENHLTTRFFSSLFTRLTQWFADTANGIAKLFAAEVHTDKLCVGQTCVTEEQFNSVFNQSAAAGAPSVFGGPEGAPSGPSAAGETQCGHRY